MRNEPVIVGGVVCVISCTKAQTDAALRAVTDKVYQTTHSAGIRTPLPAANLCQLQLQCIQVHLLVVWWEESSVCVFVCWPDRRQCGNRLSTTTVSTKDRYKLAGLKNMRCTAKKWVEDCLCEWVRQKCGTQKERNLLLRIFIIWEVWCLVESSTVFVLTCGDDSPQQQSVRKDWSAEILSSFARRDLWDFVRLSTVETGHFTRAGRQCWKMSANAVSALVWCASVWVASLRLTVTKRQEMTQRKMSHILPYTRSDVCLPWCTEE